MRKKEIPDEGTRGEELFAAIFRQRDKGMEFKQRLNLFETVRVNENFFIGKQWEGVEANGLPTPQFNFLKRVTLFQIASVTTNNLKMQASPLPAAGNTESVEMLTEIVNREFESLFEFNRVGNLIREYMRNAAVDGDGCMYSYWDPEIETGQTAKGGVRTEIVENTRVFFGDPNSRRVQSQPYIIISRREFVKDVRRRAKENGSSEWDTITPDSDTAADCNLMDDGKTTVLLRLRRDLRSGTIHAAECTRTATIRTEWDMGLRLYPITWLNWDYIQDSYHGQALITGLIPNQIFVNKLYAMSMISLMTTAYPKIVYDKTRVARWDSRVGAAIGINGGDVSSVAKIIDPATISPQIREFIESAINYTQTFLGATSAAMGDTRPDNTSAIIALQRASSVPSELTKQNLYESVEDLGRIYMDFMGEYYGKRAVELMTPEGKIALPFDFGALKAVPLSIKLDVGASAYWSEIATMQTLDNLLMQGKIELIDYLERLPEGYIPKKSDLIAKIKAQQAVMAQGGTPAGASAQDGGGGQTFPEAPPPELPATGGNSALPRAVKANPMSNTAW